MVSHFYSRQKRLREFYLASLGVLMFSSSLNLYTRNTLLLIRNSTLIAALKSNAVNHLRSIHFLEGVIFYWRLKHYERLRIYTSK